MGTNRKRYAAGLAVLRFALLVSGMVAALYAFEQLLGPRHRETVGVAEFEPQTPDECPVNLTVRLKLPDGFCARYALEEPHAEAGVENSVGERLFYVTVGLVPAAGPPADADPLRDFADRNDLTNRDGYQDVSAEFRSTPRGAVWCQRYADVRRAGDVSRQPGYGRRGAGWDRLDVLRFAEAWRGLVLELEFYAAPGRADELGPLAWAAVREMELTERPR